MSLSFLTVKSRWIFSIFFRLPLHCVYETLCGTSPRIMYQRHYLGIKFHMFSYWTKITALEAGRVVKTEIGTSDGYSFHQKDRSRCQLRTGSPSSSRLHFSRIHDSNLEGEVGVDGTDEVPEVFQAIVNRAQDNGCDDPYRLKKLLEKPCNLFRGKSWPEEPPVVIEPMTTNIFPGSVAFMAKARKYSTDRCTLIRQLMKRAVQFGLLDDYSNASWSAAPLLVQKPIQDPERNQYRLRSDLISINPVKIEQAWPLPHVNSKFSDWKNQSSLPSIFLAATANVYLETNYRNFILSLLLSEYFHQFVHNNVSGTKLQIYNLEMNPPLCGWYPTWHRG